MACFWCYTPIPTALVTWVIVIHYNIRWLVGVPRTQPMDGLSPNSHDMSTTKWSSLISFQKVSGRNCCHGDTSNVYLQAGIPTLSQLAISVISCWIKYLRLGICKHIPYYWASSRLFRCKPHVWTSIINTNRK